MKYSIHRCLAELKTLESRITSAIYGVNIVGKKKNSADRVEDTYTSVQSFNERAVSDLQKVTDLIARRQTIKDAVVNSNATTIVTIGGKSYTVAAAIERKNSIAYEKSLLAKLRTQYTNNLAEVNRFNSKMEENLDKQISMLTGSDSNNKNSDNMKGFAEEYRKQNGWELIDPLNAKEKYEKLEQEIMDFETEVDYTLSTSNSITEVEIAE